MRDKLDPPNAALDATRDDEVGEARVQEAADAYSACVMREAEKDAKNPAGAEDIAVAAQGRCWTDWERYRRVTTQTFAARASTREEKQLAAPFRRELSFAARMKKPARQRAGFFLSNGAE